VDVGERPQRQHQARGMDTSQRARPRWLRSPRAGGAINILDRILEGFLLRDRGAHRITRAVM
jgi:hypothetical protein